jgi:hypothetical protein
MSLTSVALRPDEKVHGRLSGASNGFLIFGPPKATIRGFAKPISKGL